MEALTVVRRCISKSWAVGAAVAAVMLVSLVGAAYGQRPSTDGHVKALASYLDRVQISEPIVYRGLSVFPLLLETGPSLAGQWLSLDRAMAKGVLTVSEKGPDGAVSAVVVENRGRQANVLIIAGEILTGGKQTRTVQNDVILSPGESVVLNVYCVEAHRWEGKPEFSAGQLVVPPSIQRALREGADQARIWDEVARNNKALGEENATGSLEKAINAPAVQKKLRDVRDAMLPKLPEGSVGFIFADYRGVRGAEMFGNAALAAELFPKLLDSYAIDGVLLVDRELRHGPLDGNAAIDFFKRVCAAGSDRGKTPGSGQGIVTRGRELLGGGVSLDDVLVHYSVQPARQAVPPPKPVPMPRR